MKIGLLPRVGSFWVGVHYSKYNKRWCINLIPFLTIWIIGKNGKVPVKSKM